MEHELVAYCQDHLIKWSCPREVRFVDALPQTKVGKVDYRALVKRHASESPRAAA
jgi:long-chain acyl-CoA synthetase